MKIKLSKSQWEMIGNKAGWKIAQEQKNPRTYATDEFLKAFNEDLSEMEVQAKNTIERVQHFKNELKNALTFDDPNVRDKNSGMLLDSLQRWKSEIKNNLNDINKSETLYSQYSNTNKTENPDFFDASIKFEESQPTE